ncbi:MAG: hypothetical protein HND57_02375 [Planctomycetes bacterium]|nr:hypothetical protein [Planctomycetota bacterium]
MKEREVGTTNPVLRLLIIGAIAAFVMLRLVNSPIGQWVVIVLTVGAAACAAGIYILRYEPELAKQWYKVTPGRIAFNFICALTGEQTPGGVAEAAAMNKGDHAVPTDESNRSTYSVLTTKIDFEMAAGKLRNEVIGHDRVIDEIMSDLRRAVMVRVKRPDSGGAVLGMYLLAGQPGIGKQLLAVAIGRHLYPEGGVLFLDGREYMDAASGTADLFGHGSTSGRLITAVRQEPLHTIILENADSAHQEVLTGLQYILQCGEYVDPASSVLISFEHCLVFFLSRKIGRVLGPIVDDFSAEDDWQTRASKLIIDNTGIPESVAECVHLTLPMSPLTLEERAFVVGRLMQQECQKYRVQLDWIDPEILAEEVELITDERGFDGVHARIKSRLREDLQRAVEISMPRLSIRKRPLRARRD